MDVPAPTTPAQLLDLIQLGLYWLQEERAQDPDKDEILARPVRSIVTTLGLAKAIGEGRRVSAASDARVISLVMTTGRLMQDRTRPRAEAVRRLVAEATEPFVVLVVPSKLHYDKLLGREGYRWVLTEAGQNYARSIVQEYAERVTARAFLDAWQVNLRRLRVIGAKTSGKGSRPPLAAQGYEWGSIPRANTTEDDWEF